MSEYEKLLEETNESIKNMEEKMKTLINLFIEHEKNLDTYINQLKVTMDTINNL